MKKLLGTVGDGDICRLDADQHGHLRTGNSRHEIEACVRQLTTDWQKVARCSQDILWWHMAKHLVSNRSIYCCCRPPWYPLDDGCGMCLKHEHQYLVEAWLGYQGYLVFIILTQLDIYIEWKIFYRSCFSRHLLEACKQRCSIGLDC